MTDETTPDIEPGVTAPEDDRITFTFKRTHFFAALLPIFFGIGLLIGYLVWGRGGAASPAANTTQTTTTGGQAITRYDIPIGENDPVFGPDDAPVTIVEFSDFECPYCRRHNLEVRDQLLAAYGDDIRYVFKDFPLSSIHPNAIPAAEAAHCADEQGMFWEFHSLLWQQTLGLGADAYLQYAESLNLDMNDFSECVEERRYSQAVADDYSYAANLGVSSTPTFFINGIPVIGAQPYSVFAQVIDGELNGQ
ncbi:MAG: DsbA family protein [Anaerolineae bacterium]|nr:MAG: DsbA family protein [Anaerolineae bacterium]